MAQAKLDPKKVVEFALSQVGTAENPLGSNRQKYGEMLDKLPWYLYKDATHEWIHKVNGYDWCTQFVDASFISTYTIDKAREMLYRPKYNNYGAVVKYAFNYFKNNGQGFTKEKYTPKVGDVIYFQNSKGLSHTGIVVAVSSTTVTTVEGNTGDHGWYVAKKSYSRTSSYIYGYGHPKYDVAPDPDPKEDDMKFGELKVLKYVKGKVMKGDPVEVVQSVVNTDIDGSFGPKTETAVKAFQKANGCTVDGIVGAQTWEAIFNKLK